MKRDIIIMILFCSIGFLFFSILGELPNHNNKLLIQKFPVVNCINRGLNAVDVKDMPVDYDSKVMLYEYIEMRCVETYYEVNKYGSYENESSDSYNLRKNFYYPG